MARTDYIQPDPIKPLNLGFNSQSHFNAVNKVIGDRSKPFGRLSGGKQASAQNNQNNLNRIHQAGGLVGLGKQGISKLGNNLSALGTALNKNIVNPAIDAGGQALFGKDYVPGVNQSPQQQQVPAQLGSQANQTQPAVVAPSLAHASTPPLGDTQKYRDAQVLNGSAVSFGNGHGKVSGLNPEQAERIQKSLSLGHQVSGFNMANMIASTRSDADGKIMESMRHGDINADKASALMNRDYRASDRMDRLGGNADAYIKPDAAPTNIQEAMAYGQNLNNFTRNGELNENQALLAQQNYLKSIGGLTGVAGAAGKKANSKLVMQKQYDKDGMVVGESPFVFDPNDKSFNPLGGENQDKNGTTPEEVMNWYRDPKSSEKAKKQYSDLFMEIYGMPIEQYMKGSKA